MQYGTKNNCTLTIVKMHSDVHQRNNARCNKSFKRTLLYILIERLSLSFVNNARAGGNVPAVERKIKSVLSADVHYTFPRVADDTSFSEVSKRITYVVYT